MVMALHTVGYEGTDIERWLSALRMHEIATVVDVRAPPLSRKPGCSRKTLADRLPVDGLQDIHRPALGRPKAPRNGYRADRDWACDRKGFLEYLDTQDAALGTLAAMPSKAKCAMRCFEANPTLCHRSLIAGAIALRAMSLCGTS